MRKFVLTWLLLALASPVVLAQTSYKGYKSYQKPDYPKAYDYFREALLENELDVVANYGMGLLLANNSFRNPCDFMQAFRFIRTARSAMGMLTGQQDAELKKNIADIATVITRDYDEIELKLVSEIRGKPAKERMNAAAQFVNEFPDSKFLMEMIQIRNQEVFDVVRKTDQVADYNNFIERYPDAKEVPDAVRLRNNAAYRDLIRTPELKKVYFYLARYPESEQTDRVVDLRDSLEFIQARNENTPESYNAFIRAFPGRSRLAKPLLRTFRNPMKRHRNEIPAKITRISSTDTILPNREKGR